MKLNQVIAIEKGVKTRVYETISYLHKVNQKPDLFGGFVKSYVPKDEDGEQYPPESKKVQLIASESLERFAKSLTELLDVEATKDIANCTALADVVVDGTTIMSQVPTTYLLFLEKQINDIRTYVKVLPELDPAEDWSVDVNSGLYKTGVVKTHKTKKTQKPIVLYEATDKHPAQTQMITEDVTVGYWNIVKQSGALPLPVKKKILDRVEKLLNAVKFAREEANNNNADNIKVGEQLFNYLLG
jgi:hypothetical protein